MKRDWGSVYFPVKRDLSFYLFVIRDSKFQDFNAIFDLNVTRERRVELNVIRESFCFCVN